MPGNAIRPSLFRLFRFSQRILPMPWPELCRWTGFEFDQWLLGNSRMASAVEWEFPDQGVLSFADWPEEYKLGLRLAFWSGNRIEIADPLPNVAILEDDDLPRTTLAPDDAWDLYRTTAGHVLAAEFAGHFPWSIADYNYLELKVLLSGRAMFTFYDQDGGYTIDEAATKVLPSPPAIVDDFLASNNIVGNSRLDTIVRLTAWCRDNMKHYVGGREVIHFEYNWQYRGYPPVSRIINRTPVTNPDPSYQDNCVLSRTAGCWGTTGFYRAVLRLANIPVMRQAREGGGGGLHSAPRFSTEAMMMCHGDDPYSSNCRSTPPFSAQEVLIDEDTYVDWFGPQVPEYQRRINLSRKVAYDLVIKHWPDFTLRQFCQDLAEGKTGQDSRVFQSLARYEALDSATWETYKAEMQARIDAFGGCSGVPQDTHFDPFCD